MRILGRFTTGIFVAIFGRIFVTIPFGNPGKSLGKNFYGNLGKNLGKNY